jgi:hypothetical protein
MEMGVCGRKIDWTSMSPYITNGKEVTTNGMAEKKPSPTHPAKSEPVFAVGVNVTNDHAGYDPSLGDTVPFPLTVIVNARNVPAGVEAAKYGTVCPSVCAHTFA